ncbi:hypothetical protein DFJ77DRAFT_233956 [Powellomyces hirtus]|nr:hypothetical protein DFJ77DRAFT_233956 [Powellomyces hirtus]
MTEFLGMDVRLYLTNGFVLDGRVASIDQSTQLLTLHGASTFIDGIQQRFATYPVPGQDIVDLQILPGPQQSASQPPPQQPQRRHGPASSSMPPPPPGPGTTPPHPHYHPPPPPRIPHPHHPHPMPPAPPSPPQYGHLPRHPDHPPAFDDTPPPPPPPAMYATRPVAQNNMQPPRPPSPAQYGHAYHHLGPLPTQHQHQQRQQQPPQQKSQSSNAAFVDPAILSLTRTNSGKSHKQSASNGILNSAATSQRLNPSSSSPRNAPSLAKTPSGGSTGPRASQVTPKPTRKAQASAAINVTESELDDAEEVDFSEMNGSSIRNSPHKAHARGKSAGRQVEASALGRTPGKGGRGQVDGSKSRRGRRGETFEGDVANLSDDFDFQAGLTQFDKRRVFAEIRQADATAPETLLVNLNRIRPGMQKLGIRDMVLDSSSIAPSGDETGNDAEVDSDLESDGAALLRQQGGAEFGNGQYAGGGETNAGRRAVCRTLGGVIVPTVSPTEMLEIERIAMSETGPSDEQMIENGGRGCAMMVLQALGGNRRIKPGNHNDNPYVVVLAGNNKTGAYGLAAARHLANHECNVLVVAVGSSDAELVNTVATQQKIYFPTGGKLTRGVVDLPHPTTQPVDLIVDALLGPYQTILDLADHDKSLVCDLIQWANENKANVLSLDVPSGVNAVTGIPMSPLHRIIPKWTLALGLPKHAHLRTTPHHHHHNNNNNHTTTPSAAAPSTPASPVPTTRGDTCGELFLADIGIPRVVVQKANRAAAAAQRLYQPPFGDKFLVALEIVEM